jgi:hypothetical protein
MHVFALINYYNASHAKLVSVMLAKTITIHSNLLYCQVAILCCELLLYMLICQPESYYQPSLLIVKFSESVT